MRLCRRRGVPGGSAGCPRRAESVPPRHEDLLTRAVSTPHRLSTAAALETLASGGNAVDAAITATATQGVVAPETCGVGGDLFALIHQPGWDRPRSLNSSGTAGSGADPQDLIRRDISEIPRDHPLAVTIPGCVSGWAELSMTLGSIPLGDALAPAIRIASDGFEVSTEQAAAFRSTAAMYSHHAAVAEFYPGGVPVKVGERVSRPNLAATLEAIAIGGPEAFYRGRPGADIVEELGGMISADDLARPVATWVEPIAVEVAGLRSWTTPPNSQGYLGPATLAVFEMLDPPDDPEDPDWSHLMIEAYRSLAWERDDIVADPAHAPLPVELLLDPERLGRAAATISRDRAGIWPRRMGSGSDTAYMCMVDDRGMSVSVIQSNYSGTGSAFGARHSGFLLQDRGRGFSLTPGHPNEAGPGKRPLHTLAPTIWTESDEPRWVIGTRGGALQPQLVAQLAGRAVIAGQGLAEAQVAGRWTVQDFGPGSEPVLSVEPGVSPSVLESLRARGHQILVTDGPQRGWGPMSIIRVDGEGRDTARDPRVDTTSAVVV